MIYRLVEDVSPYYNYTYDMYSRYESIPIGDEKKDNLQLWRKQTGCHLSEDQLEAVVYRWSIDKLKQEQTLVAKELGKDGYELLLVAKLCESVRDYLNDPWYYPSKNDPQVMAMNEHLEGAMNYRGKLLNRYALQVVRMLMATSRSDEAIAYWEKVKPLLSEDVVTGMAERRVAAAYLKAEKTETAIHIYAKYGDLSSLRQCGLEEGAEWELIYKECPDSPFFIRELQSVLVHYDNRLYQCLLDGSNEEEYHNWGYYEDENHEQKEVARIKALARRVINEKRTKKLDIWYYSLAALLDAECKYDEALKVISEGQKHCKKGSFLANSMRVLRICVEAASCKYDDTYKARLTTDLKWMDENGIKNMPKRTNNGLSPNFHYTRTKYCDNIVGVGNNRYYWSDVITRICGDVLASRLKMQGYVADALMFANMGEYWLPNRAYGKNRSFGDCDHYMSDYYSTMAQMADTCSAKDVEKAYLRLVYPKGELDTFISGIAYTEKNFWCDMIGTYYIKEQKYSNAVKWLSQCNRKWQESLSVYEYFDRDPFSPLFGLEPNKKSILKSKYDYKLNYARKMVKYENDMHHAKDVDVRGEAMIKYGIGIRNQNDWAWALTRYCDSWDRHVEYRDDDYRPIRDKQSEKLIDDGLALMHNKELKAQYLHAFVRNKEVMELCSDTKMAEYLRSHCDLWRNYKKKAL